MKFAAFAAVAGLMIASTGANATSLTFAVSQGTQPTNVGTVTITDVDSDTV